MAYRSFGEFWPFYVREHAHRLNRQLHFIGTSSALVFLAVALSGHPWGWALAPIFGYGFAWTGHFFVEKNRPATFRYPLYSLAADFVMYSKIWQGRMESEVQLHCGAAG